MIERHRVFRANFTRGRDWVTNWKIPLQSSPRVFVPFPPCPLAPILCSLAPLHFCPDIYFFFLSIIFSFSLFMFAHMYERSTLCRPVNVDTSTSSLPALNIHSAVHPFITLSYFSLHAQTGIHLNNSDLFISFCRCCRKYFHSVTSVVLKLWVHASSLVCVLL